MPISTATNLDYLIDTLRLHLGDTTTGSYRYTDEWLRTSLVASVKGLMPWWNDKYTVDTDNNAQRNTTNWVYDYTSPPLIQIKDERPIILYASIIIKGGSLESHSWDLNRWKDAELSFSNIAGGNAKEKSLEMDTEELHALLQPPTKKLRRSLKGDLPGYRNNPHESKLDY